MKYFAPKMSYIGSVNLNEHVRDTTTGNVYSIETYLEDHWQPNDRWSLDAGVRFSLLAVPNASYYSLQPRLSISYRMGESLLLKTSWARMQQSQHLLTSNSMGMNTDLWVPVTQRVAPASSDLFSIACFYAFANTWNFSIEGYFHRMNHVVR